MVHMLEGSIFNKKENGIRIVIVEINAHLAGHFTKEINEYASQLSGYVEEIVILTPYGFKDTWDSVDHCRVVNLLQARLEECRKLSSRTYDIQFLFYKYVKEYLKKENYNIVHFWDYRSIFPIWVYFRSFHSSKKIISLKFYL